MSRAIAGKSLLWICAVGAAASAAATLGAMTAAPLEVRLAETWRGYGFVVFAGLFVLLALRPRQHPIVWLLAILHKCAMAVTALAYARSGVPDATTVAAADGAVTVFLVAAYLLIRPTRGQPDQNTERNRSWNR